MDGRFQHHFAIPGLMQYMAKIEIGFQGDIGIVCEVEITGQLVSTLCPTRNEEILCRIVFVQHIGAFIVLMALVICNRIEQQSNLCIVAGRKCHACKPHTFVGSQLKKIEGGRSVEILSGYPACPRVMIPDLTNMHENPPHITHLLALTYLAGLFHVGRVNRNLIDTMVYGDVTFHTQYFGEIVVDIPCHDQVVSSRRKIGECESPCIHIDLRTADRFRKERTVFVGNRLFGTKIASFINIDHDSFECGVEIADIGDIPFDRPRQAVMGHTQKRLQQITESCTQHRLVEIKVDRRFHMPVRYDNRTFYIDLSAGNEKRFIVIVVDLYTALRSIEPEAQLIRTIRQCRIEQFDALSVLKFEQIHRSGPAEILELLPTTCPFVLDGVDRHVNSCHILIQERRIRHIERHRSASVRGAAPATTRNEKECCHNREQRHHPFPHTHLLLPIAGYPVLPMLSQNR